MKDNGSLSKPSSDIIHLNSPKTNTSILSENDSDVLNKVCVRNSYRIIQSHIINSSNSSYNIIEIFLEHHSLRTEFFFLIEHSWKYSITKVSYSIVSYVDILHFDLLTTFNSRAENHRYRSVIEGLKEEIESWNAAYRELQKKHSHQVERLIAEFNDRETKLKSQVCSRAIN